MKKLLISLFAFSFLFAGCNMLNRSDNNTDTSDNTTTTDDNTTTNDSTTKDNDNTTNDNSTTNNNNNVADGIADTFESFETALANAGITIQDKAENFADKIGAKEGYKYNSDQGYIEMYYFDDQDALTTIKADKKVTVNGKDYPVVVNGNWVLFTNDLAYQDDVNSIFNTLK